MKRKKSDNRKTAAQRGYGHRWRKERAQFLQDYPLCRMCQARGIVTAATVVDHIIPHRGNAVLFWNRDNWQSLCEHCHNAHKQRQENKAIRLTPLRRIHRPMIDDIRPCNALQNESDNDDRNTSG